MHDSLARSAARRSPRRRRLGRDRILGAGGAIVLAFTLAVALDLGTAPVFAQAMPSGEYGSLPLGASVEGTLPAATDQAFQYHTYWVEIPSGIASVTVAVDGLGSDLDVALRLGAPIDDYDDADVFDISDAPNPTHTVSVGAGDTLYVDVLNLVYAQASYRLTVTAAASTPPSGSAAPPAASGGNPLAPVPTDPFVGAFAGDGLRVTVEASGGAYEGALTLAGQTYPFQARATGSDLVGAFSSGNATFDFSATLSGDTLTVTSGGASYRTHRVAAAPGRPVNPLGGGSAAASGTVLAQGARHVLTEDDALAFIEALEFSLAQIGYAQPFTDAERAQILDALASGYGSLSPDEQAVLAQARDVWSRVQQNWPVATQADRQEFVIGVLVLAFGEEAVQPALGGGGSSAGAAGCATIDDCMSTYASPDTYDDVMNANSCWAAAGCSEYDSGTDTFYYDDYGDSYGD